MVWCMNVLERHLIDKLKSLEGSNHLLEGHSTDHGKEGAMNIP